MEHLEEEKNGGDSISMLKDHETGQLVEDVTDIKFKGGTQNSGYQFGQGNDKCGGGWYGGDTSKDSKMLYCGSGGSGYIGGVIGGTGTTSSQKVKSGDGYARITFLESSAHTLTVNPNGRNMEW